MHLSFKMIILSLVLFLSDACVSLNAAGNQNLLLEDDGNEEDDLLYEAKPVTFLGKWIDPENIRDKALS